MGKGLSPTREELEFIYNLFLQGCRDPEVLKEYEELRKHGKLGALPYRQDIRFVRQRRKEFEVLRALLELRVKQQLDPALAQRRKEHWDELATLSKKLAQDATPWTNCSKDYLGKPLHPPQELDGLQALVFIKKTGRTVIPLDEYPEADQGLYPFLHIHLKAEDPQWESKMLRLKDAVVSFHSQCYTLAQKIAKICEHDENFPSSWQVFIHKTGLDFYFGTKELSAQLEKEFKPKQKGILEAQSELEAAITPIKEKLELVSRRRSFQGRCPACP